MKPTDEHDLVLPSTDERLRVGAEDPFAELDAALKGLPLVPAPPDVTAKLDDLARPRRTRHVLLRIVPPVMALAAAVAMMVTVQSSRIEESPAVKRATTEAVVALGLIRDAFDRVEQRTLVDVVDERLPAAVDDVLGSWPDERRFE